MKASRLFFLVLLLGILFCVLYYRLVLRQHEFFRSTVLYPSTKKIVEEHVYRYVASANETVAGKIFDMGNETTRMVEEFLRETIFKRKPILLDPTKSLFDVVVSATAADATYYDHLYHCVDYFASRFPGQKLIVYNLGLTEQQADDIRKRPHVILRMFDFNKYPPHIRHLKNYAWKILLIGSLFAEFDGVLWFDSAIKLNGGKYGNFNHVLGRLIHLKSEIAFYLHYELSHSVLAATHPRTLEYFPMAARRRHLLEDDMLSGGTILVFNTADMKERVMKWAAICALVKDCIEPPGSRLICPANIWTIPRTQYAGCHRYDQAVLSLLVFNLYGDSREKYRWGGSESLGIKVDHGKWRK